MLITNMLPMPTATINSSEIGSQRKAAPEKPGDGAREDQCPQRQQLTLELEAAQRSDSEHADQGAPPAAPTGGSRSSWNRPPG